MTPDETIARLRAELAQCEASKLTFAQELREENEALRNDAYVVEVRLLRADLAREKERADSLAIELRQAKLLRAETVSSREWEDALTKNDVLEKELANTSDVAKTLDNLYVASQHKLQAAESRLAALHGHADRLARALKEVLGYGPKDGGDEILDYINEIAETSLFAYRAFTAEGKKGKS